MYNIAAVEFANESAARLALKGLSETPKINGTTIYQIALVKQEYNSITAENSSFATTSRPIISPTAIPLRAA